MLSVYADNTLTFVILIPSIVLFVKLTLSFCIIRWLKVDLNFSNDHFEGYMIRYWCYAFRSVVTAPYLFVIITCFYPRQLFRIGR